MSGAEEPSTPWIRIAAFLLGGLISLICYRFLVIVITSFIGAFLLTLGGLAFAAQHGEADTVSLASKNPAMVTATLIILAAVGTVGQYLVERHRAAHRKDRVREPTLELIRRILKVKPSS
jgi:hypothetical protein